MKKATCPQCGLVNLEKFVSFPNCAGCGTFLGTSSGEAKPVFWRRRLRAPLWATLVGLGCAALGVAAIGVARETARSDDANLMVYIQVPRQVPQGGILLAQLTLDTTEGAPSTREFSNVRLRLPGEIFKSMKLLGVQPPPDETASSGSGRYFVFKSLPRETTVKLSFRATKPGQHRFSTTVSAAGFYGFRHSSSFLVVPAQKAKSGKN